MTSESASSERLGRRGRRLRFSVGSAVLAAAGLLAAIPAASSALVIGPRWNHVAGTGQTGQINQSTTTCTNSSVLSTWSNQRLALLTIAVPVEETSVGSVAPEVRQGVGGVVLFGSTAPTNLGPQLATLRSQVPQKLGLLVMTDEEGGGVQRMANLVGNLPWPRWMAQNWTVAQMRQAVYEVGLKMKAAGVNMDLAPVVDVDGSNVPPGDTNPDGYRSFSGNTAVVTKYGVAFAEALRKAHVIPVLKHFPGLGGSAPQNTDLGPAHTVPWSQEVTRGIPPFKAGIAANLPAIMTSNATVPGLASFPASLSPAATSRELESTLGFHGFVLTDSLSAGAILQNGPTYTAWTIPSASVQALVAGADMVLFSSTPGTTVQGETNNIASAVVSAVGHGTLPRSHLIAAAAAVLAVRHKSLCG